MAREEEDGKEGEEQEEQEEQEGGRGGEVNRMFIPAPQRLYPQGSSNSLGS